MGERAKQYLATLNMGIYTLSDKKEVAIGAGGDSLKALCLVNIVDNGMWGGMIIAGIITSIAQLILTFLNNPFSVLNDQNRQQA